MKQTKYTVLIFTALLLLLPLVALPAAEPSKPQTKPNIIIILATVDRVPSVWIENHKVLGLDPADPIEVSYLTNLSDEPTGLQRPDLQIGCRLDSQKRRSLRLEGYGGTNRRRLSSSQPQSLSAFRISSRLLR